MLLLAAQRRAQREQERVGGLHLCLSAWRAGGDGEGDGDGGGDGGGGDGEGPAPAKQQQQRRRARARRASAATPGQKESDDQSKEPPALRDGTPLGFALCRRRQNQHQQWTTEALGASAEGAFRIRSTADPALCVSVQPIYYRMRDVDEIEARREGGVRG
jgi:hypothetical protein